MSTLPTTHTPPISLGMLSQVLGAIGLLLFFLPVLGLPISAFGLLFGLIGVAAGLSPGGLRLRWSVVGCMVSTLALAINAAIAYAPRGYLAAPTVPPAWQPVPDRPAISPPASPQWRR